MPYIKMPADGGRGGHSETVSLSRREHSEDSPTTLQTQARQHLREARLLAGGSRFAALSLAAHYGARAQITGGANG